LHLTDDGRRLRARLRPRRGKRIPNRGRYRTTFVQGREIFPFVLLPFIPTTRKKECVCVFRYFLIRRPRRRRMMMRRRSVRQAQRRRPSRGVRTGYLLQILFFRCRFQHPRPEVDRKRRIEEGGIVEVERICNPRVLTEWHLPPRTSCCVRALTPPYSQRESEDVRREVRSFWPGDGKFVLSVVDVPDEFMPATTFTCVILQIITIEFY